jgi:hypothetical protein
MDVSSDFTISAFGRHIIIQKMGVRSIEEAMCTGNTCVTFSR